MKTHSHQSPRADEQTYSRLLAPSNDEFYELTFLNMVALVFLDPTSTSSLSKVQKIKDLMLRHYQIDSAGISQVHLINVKNNHLVGDDQDLHERQYFLAFSRLGKQVPSSSNDLQEEESLPLLQKRLFHRVSSIITVKQRSRHPLGRVEVLEPDKTKKCQFQHYCPFLDCAKPFKRSCDLLIHFRVQAGIRPYTCPGCQKLFRRKILLDKHQSRGICGPAIALNPLQAQLSEKREIEEMASIFARKNPSLACNQCGQKCSSLEALDMHWKQCPKSKQGEYQKCHNAVTLKTSLPYSRSPCETNLQSRRSWLR